MIIKKASLLNIPIFLIFPLLSFLIAIRNLKSRTNGVVFVAFCALFGYSFSFGNDSADSYRVALVFDAFDYKSLFDIYQLYLLGGAPDLYRFLVYSFVKSFTDNPKVLFAVFGFVFGVFWYLSLRIFKKEQKSYKSFYIYLIYFIFLILNPITNINGARFNTAAWVFFLATVNIILYKKKGYYVMLLCAPLVHFSFIFGVAIVVLFSFFKDLSYTSKRVNKILYYSFIASFAVSWILASNIISFDFISKIIPSESISGKIDTYNSSEVSEIYEKRASNSPFLMVSNFFQIIIKTAFFFIIIYLKKFSSKQPLLGYKINVFLSFVMFYFTLAFIIGTMPSGNRFLMVGYIFCVLLMLLLFVKYPNSIDKKYALALIPIFSFKFFFNIIFLSISITSHTIWYGNLLWIIYEGWDYKFIHL